MELELGMELSNKNETKMKIGMNDISISKRTSYAILV